MVSHTRVVGLAAAGTLIASQRSLPLFLPVNPAKAQDRPATSFGFRGLQASVEAGRAV
jgi:hypothetical protein